MTTSAVAIAVDNVGDSRSAARTISFSNGTYAFTDRLGEGAYGLKDVDIYKLVVSDSDVRNHYTFTTSQPSGGTWVDTYLRLFNDSSTGWDSGLLHDDDSGSNGYSSLTWTPTTAGTYYLGVSSYGNRSYNPGTAGSAATDGTAGDYTLTITNTAPFSGFNVTECRQIQAFLEQTDSDGVSNGTKINASYSADDPATWTGITWTTRDGVKRATEISWYGFKLTGTLNLSGSSALRSLSCSSNQLAALDVSGCTSLSKLYCYSNQLAALDVSKNTALTDLYCFSNQIASLDVSKNTALTLLSCDSNQLAALDVSKNTALTNLQCSSNQLASLDVTQNTALTYLGCYDNRLASLNVSNNTGLEILWCSSNRLASLDVSKNTALEYLNCNSNQLASLGVSKNTTLSTLYCGFNQLAALDVSKNTALTGLDCSSNQLASLDVSKNTALTSLYCWNRDLTTVIMPSSAIGKTNIYPYPGSNTTWTFENSSGTSVGATTQSYYTCYTISELPLTAVNAAGTQTISFVDVTALVPLSTPTFNSATASGTTVSCVWQSVPNASGYSLEYRPDGAASWTTKSVSDTSATFEGTAGLTYDIRVKAVGNVTYSDSNYSTSRSVTLAKITLSTPTLTSATASGATVSCAWQNVPNASGYSLEYRPDGTSGWTTKSVSDTSATFEGTAGTTYDVRVKAVGTGSYSDSEYSMPKSVTLPQNKVQQVSSTAPVITSIGSPLTIPVCYQTLDDSASLTELGLRIHYDSRVLEYTGFANQLPTGFTGTPQDQLDVGNADGDSATDRVITAAWQDLEGTRPDQTQPAKLLDLLFRVKDSAPTGVSSAVRFTAGSLTSGYSFSGTDTIVTVTGDPQIRAVTTKTPLDSHDIEVMNFQINEWSAINVEFWNFLEENQTFEITYDSNRFLLDPKQVRKQDFVQVEFGESSTVNGVTTLAVELALTENHVLSDANTLMAVLNFTPINSKNSIATGEKTSSVLSVNGIAQVEEIFSVPYDLNDDGAVEIMDLVQFARLFNKSSNASAPNYHENAQKADFNSDGTVDILDLILFAKNFNTTPTRASSVHYSPDYVPAGLTSIPASISGMTVTPRITDFAMNDFFDEDEEDDNFLLSGTIKKWKF